MTIEFTPQDFPDISFCRYCKTIEICYHIPAGIQLEYHPNPGVPYPETTRVAYLPDNVEGRTLLRRFKYAWKHGLMFNVGTSITDQADNRVVWSTIPHKTSLRGRGPYSFPDENYIPNCNNVLDGLNVPAAADLLCL